MSIIAYDQSVRKLMTDAGYDNSKIGMDPASGYVTYEGNPFLKAQKFYNYTNYTDQPSFSAANTAYQQKYKAQPATQPVQTQPAQTVQPYVNPQDKQISDLIAQLTQRVNTPSNYSPYGTPEYAAYQAQAQQGAQQAIRQGQEALGTSGMARSSDLVNWAQNAQNQANQYLQTQVVPQLIAAQQQKEQQQLSNLMSLLNPLQQQQSLYDDRQQNQFANDLSSKQFDRGVLESDRNYNYQVGRDKVADQQWAMQFNNANRQWKSTFDEDNRRYGQDYALRKLTQDHNISMDKAQLLISQQNADTSRMGANLNQQQFDWSKDYNNPDNVYRRDQIQNNKFDQLYKSWQATGQAPAGLEELGVKMGQRWRDLTPSDAISQLSKSQFVSTSVDPTTGQQQFSISNPQGLAGAILSMPLRDDEIDQIARYFGIDLDAMQKQAMGN